MENKNDFDLVVYSHLRWDYVYQRPQHLMERLGKNRKVLIIEEPIGFVSYHKIPNIIEVSENITVLQPRSKWEDMLGDYEELTKKFMSRLGIENPVLWFYGPAFQELRERIPHKLLVYDCMDEHAAFKTGNTELANHDKTLVQKADVVFTGGKSLFDAKRQINESAYCFPSSVDLDHFQKALDPATQIPADLAKIKKPVVAYYGVIDERIDYELLSNIADLMPEVSFVMVGPIIKVDPASMPKRDNLHFLGGKDYKDLPAYLKGFDIAMMPFAMNESTKYISPTKTLEYMAGLKPIISTPVYDVVRDYSKEVAIINNDKPEEFKAAVDRYLAETPEQRQEREKLHKAVIEKTSWDKTAAEMEKIIQDALKS